MAKCKALTGSPVKGLIAGGPRNTSAHTNESDISIYNNDNKQQQHNCLSVESGPPANVYLTTLVWTWPWPLTLILNLDLDVLKICLRTKNEISMSRHSKVRSRTRQTDRLTDATERITNHYASFVGGKIAVVLMIPVPIGLRCFHRRLSGLTVDNAGTNGHFHRLLAIAAYCT